MTSTLVIGDSHASPQSPNRRFEWLGKFIVDRQPDIVISIGDWADLSTLSSYDKGTKQAWGKLYKEDVKSVIESQELLFNQINKYNQKQAKLKKPQYKPKTVMILGNHDDGRYNTFISKSPEFEGHISIDDLQYKKFWDTVVPYLDVHIESNICFSHFFYTKSQRYPAQTAKQVLQLNHSSSVWGHSHSFDYAIDYHKNGTKLIAVNVGCFLDPFERGDTYNYTGGQGERKWWNGLVMLNNVNDKGEFDVEQVSMDVIQAKYA